MGEFALAVFFLLIAVSFFFMGIYTETRAERIIWISFVNQSYKGIMVGDEAYVEKEALADAFRLVQVGAQNQVAILKSCEYLGWKKVSCRSEMGQCVPYVKVG